MCWHSELTFTFKRIRDDLIRIIVDCAPSEFHKHSLFQLLRKKENGNGSNDHNAHIKAQQDLKEYYFGWINPWNSYSMTCDKTLRQKLNDKFCSGLSGEGDNGHDQKTNAVDTVDVDKLHALKWNFHHKLAIHLLAMKSDRRMKRKVSKRDVVDTISLAANQFKNRTVSSLTTQEKLVMVEEVF